MKKIIIILSSVVFFIVISYSLLKHVVDNDNLKKFTRLVPNYFNWKDKTKDVLNLSKFNNYVYNFKTDGKQSFKLKNHNIITIHSNFNSKKKMEIQGVGKKNTISCYKKEFIKDYLLKLKDLDIACKNSLYFIGKIETNVKNKKLENYFYFGFEPERIKSKNLLVIPTTNFYNYSNNQFVLNRYQSNIDFLANSNEINNMTALVWADKVGLSIQNITKNLIKDYDIISDLDLENISLDNYNLIVLPMHNEYLSYKMIDNLISFLESGKTKKILSLGGANFENELTLINNFQNEVITLYYPKIARLKWDRYKYISPNFKITTFDEDEIYQDCYFQDDLNLDLGEKYVINNLAKHYFYNIQCKDQKLPLLSILEVGKGKLIKIQSDGIGLNFHNIDYLKDKILEIINNNT